jgi:hypothetical protein
MSEHSIRPGDHVVFRGLPESCKPTPLFVSAAKDGMIELKNHGGWYKACLFQKVEVHELGAEDAPRDSSAADFTVGE